MVNLIDKLRKLAQLKIARDPATAVAPGAPSLTLNNDAITSLMRQIDETQEDQYSCAETFDLLDEYVEMVDTGADAAALMPLVEHHIHACPDCRERFEALLLILQTAD